MADSILDLPMQENDAEAPTIRAYLARLAREMWEEGEGADGKRPFGNSGWEHELYGAVAAAGIVPAEVDDWGHLRLSREATERVDELMNEALDQLEKPAGPDVRDRIIDHLQRGLVHDGVSWIDITVEDEPVVMAMRPDEIAYFEGRRRSADRG